ncbi:hypothetical protein [Streptomyces flaveolus]|uniref:hypothetical protein n=1 Tax=Streptomyces flaveolus TaxID=67297 RepID=UPI0034015C65
MDMSESAHKYALTTLYEEEFTYGDLLSVIKIWGGGDVTQKIARSIAKEMFKSDFIMQVQEVRPAPAKNATHRDSGEATYKLTPLGKGEYLTDLVAHQHLQ